MEGFNWSEAFAPRGIATSTAAPMNASDEDLPPGAGGTYYGGPLANPRPSPTPGPKFSLETLANGGFNHAQAWMAGQASPVDLPKQAQFSSGEEEDLPPGAGAGTYYGGPLANPPRPSPTPGRNTAMVNEDLLKKFNFSDNFSSYG